MNTNFIVIDNFYTNPIETRNSVLETQSFDIEGNFPGYRTNPVGQEHSLYLKKFFEVIINKPITYWPGEYNTSFQYTTKEDTTWIHHDDTEWAGVVYLTPDAPLSSGTGLFQHIETGIDTWVLDEPETDFNKSNFLGDDSIHQWSIMCSAGNKFNRLVLYNGHAYHRSLDVGFGSSKHDGRLFQTFFFSTY